MRVDGLTIGGLTFPGASFLAPMSGITDRPFRVLAERFGAGMVVSEMIASAALAGGQKDMLRRLRRPERLPHVVQLAGCEPEWIAEGARIAADAGADLIDINMGCPAKRVTGGTAGSALMRAPEMAVRLVEAAVAAVDLPVTVKMRLGWDDQSLNAPGLARRAAEAGARMITVHGRTRQQFYKGAARWAPVAEVVAAAGVPVVVNGDIASPTDARRALELSGAAAVMVGRAAQGRPWRVGEIGAVLAGGTAAPAPTGAGLRALVLEHFEMMRVEYGDALGVRCARKHLGWYLDAMGTPVAPAARRALLTEADPDRVTLLIAELFADELRAAA